MQRQQRLLAIHDISCFGKCSLTVALPIISAAGVEVAAIPTAVLSTHTGDLEGYTFRDLTEDILPIVSHWQSLGLTFDAIYTGYLGSFEQIGIVTEVIGRLRREGMQVIVDPVMADEGRLYANFPPDFPAGMRALCREADVLVPNMTEAALLLGEPYHAGPYDRPYIEGMLARLLGLGAKAVVLTGVWFDRGELGCACLRAGEAAPRYALTQRVEGMYHGTGDVFASALTGALLRGKALAAAGQLAAEFTAGCVARSLAAGTDNRHGVNFEAGLPGFMRALGLE